MRIQLTQGEAMFLIEKIQEPNSSLGGLEDASRSESAEAIELRSSIETKLFDAMKKSDAVIDRQLAKAIRVLAGAGFDDDQIEALNQAKLKATIHNQEKYSERKKK